VVNFLLKRRRLVVCFDPERRGPDEVADDEVQEPRDPGSAQAVGLPNRDEVDVDPAWSPDRRRS